ncbi:hypothetical protein GCM10009556_066280 [Acrocarpospora pleiomorpha]
MRGVRAISFDPHAGFLVRGAWQRPRRRLIALLVPRKQKPVVAPAERFRLRREPEAENAHSIDMIALCERPVARSFVPRA